MDLLFEANRLAGELASELRKTLRTEAEEKTPSGKRTIVAYSGNFQPFHAGHYKIYRTLVKKFGKDNVYVTTTNQQEEVDNPMSYADKKKLATQMFDIEDGKFQEVKNPFVPVELLKKYSPKDTSLVTVISTDDADAIAKSEYFHKYVDGQQLKGYTDAAYYLTVPELAMNIGGQHLTNPQIMQVLGSPKTSKGVKEKMFKSLYGADNPEMLALISNRAEPGAADLDGEFGKTDATGQKNASAPGKTKASGQDNETDDEEEADDDTPLMQQMIVNPLTGREIKVQSALKYPRWKPVYKKAEAKLKAAGIDRKNRVEEPEVNARYKARAKRMKKDELAEYLGQVLSEQLHNDARIHGTTLNVPGLGEVHLKLDESFLPGLKTESDAHAPVAIYVGRFQPFHKGHYHAYEDLVKKFGKENVYIATSNKTDGEKSPFNFNDKQNIITQLFDIDPSHVVQSVNPYKAVEITSKLPENTPVVFGLGEKDADRLAQSKYFQKYDPSKPLDVGYRDGGYTYIVPQLPMQINGKTITGTGVRDVFAKGSPDAQKALFHRLYGTDNPEMLGLITNRIKNGPFNPSPEKKTTSVKTNKKASTPDEKTKSGSMRSRLKDKIKNPETNNDIQVATALKYDKAHPAYKIAKKYLQGKNPLTESLLLEGGAYGHLLHPYEDLDMTFGDLRELTSRALGKGLDKDGPVMEKTDGQNIMFTVRDGQVKFARSIKHLKNRGEEAMSPEELRQKFSGRGAIEKTFGMAGNDLQHAVEQMPPEQVEQIFGDGRKFMSVEVIHPESENTIPYGRNVLVLHHTIEFDENGKPIGHNDKDSELMADALRDVGAEQQSEFGIQGQHFVVFDDADVEKMQQKIKKYNDEISKFESDNGLTDKNTIRDYKAAWWNNQMDRSKVKLTPEDREVLLGRWIDGNKSTRLTSLSSPEVQSWAKKVEPSVQSMNNKNIYPIQSLVARLGVDSLDRATSLLTSQNPQAGKILKAKLAKAFKTIHDSGDQDKISQIDRFMKLIDEIGLDRIVPSEGLVFSYGDKLYKFTGAFAPINRVIGAIKYDDTERGAPASEVPPTKEPSRMDKLKARTNPPEEPISTKTAIDPTAKVKNPETERDILVKTALKYDKSHPAYKAAEKLVHGKSN